jgi:hypothetical protein
MVNRISWTECLTYLAIGLAIYYAAVAFIFYRMEIYALLKGGYKQSRFSEPYLSAAPTSVASENRLYNEVLELMQDCKPVFQAAVDNPLDKSQVLEALQLRLRKYPQIIGTAFQVAVSNHIDQELQARCGMSLKESDIQALWQ